jgi:hypothetical protein
MSSRATAGTRRDPKHLSSRYGPESGNELRARYFGSLIAIATPNFPGPLDIGLMGWGTGFHKPSIYLFSSISVHELLRPGGTFLVFCPPWSRVSRQTSPAAGYLPRLRWSPVGTVSTLLLSFLRISPLFNATAAKL